MERFSRVVEERGERFLARVFAPAELESDPSIQTLAGRFAAKEAILKALGTGLAEGVSWRDMRITGGGGRPPSVETSGAAASMLEGRKVHVSISHAAQYALAMAVTEDLEG